MRITTIADRVNPEQSYARIKDVPCFFSQHATGTPPVGVELDVMITGVHYFFINESETDKTRPKRLFIRGITSYYAEIDHGGFYKDANGAVVAHATFDDRTITLLAGRTSVRADKKPGVAYVRRRDLSKPFVRVEGVAELKDLECWKFFSET